MTGTVPKRDCPRFIILVEKNEKSGISCVFSFLGIFLKLMYNFYP